MSFWLRECLERNVRRHLPLSLDLAIDNLMERWLLKPGQWRLRKRLHYLLAYPLPCLKSQARKILTAWRLQSQPQLRTNLMQRQMSQSMYTHLANHACADWLAYRILIIAEATIPQCLKYRVLQRQKMLQELGIQCNWLSWHDNTACMTALQTHQVVIFYRTPWLPSLQAMHAEAKRLGLTCYWEVDDLVFDQQYLRHSAALQGLDRATFRGVLRGARLYGDALRTVGTTIASTPVLANQMLAHGAQSALVVPNALDDETLALAEQLRVTSSQDTNCCRIGYGSGTETHDRDFLEASEALVALLKRNPQLRLRVMGLLQLPAGFAEVAEQVERYSIRSYGTYLQLLAECDLTIAPLEPGLFNDCKSNIKYLESAILELPAVCSARAEFAGAIVSGVDGLLADTTQQWRQALQALIDSPGLRKRIGTAARQRVLQHYAPKAIASRHLGFLADQRPSSAQQRQRLLSVNVFYGPQSFGGATLVAEALNQRLPKFGWDVAVFTTIPDKKAAGKSLHRYHYNQEVVFAVPASTATSTSDDVSSASTLAAFKEVLDSVQPTVVHFHCLQGLGIEILECCVERHIPYLITLHDAWWLCARQFMITPSGRYCNQTFINTQACITCTGEPNLVHGRRHRMAQALHRAALLLAPGPFFADLYRANGFTEVLVNGNGIALPTSAVGMPSPAAGAPVRFAYLGGNTPIKGFPLVQQVFRRLRADHLQLVLVDNTLNLGHASYFPLDLLGLNNVQVVAAFTQDQIDDFFGDIDVLLFPTQWKESFGLAVREALARGIWVISSDAGGAVEDLVDGMNGRILPFPPDADRLADAVLEAAALVRQWRQHPESKPCTRVRSQDEQATELVKLLDSIVPCP